MVKMGMLIADRYEFLEKIGTGGMSDVYKAKDQKLNRFVAIKVLKQEFSENSNFVSKFRIEAQAAAGLMHPNIVNVYDVGEEDGLHYIVMELVEGITLKKYIEKKSRLSVKEAVSIAIQVAMGIEAAHNNHVIHRDIKPQNIIISKEGKVKVTDFGIAKAATSNTISSNVMGSVHYTSPEQARGGFSDEKSDVYSLGITIFEMLTGRVPFNGETTVAIAIKQIQDAMPSPRTFVPEIPVSVEQIVLKCTLKSPDRRYQNMAALIADLKHSLVNPDEDFVNINASDDLSKTRIVPEMDTRRNTGRIATPPLQETYLTEENEQDIPVRTGNAQDVVQEEYYPEDGYEEEVYPEEEYADDPYAEDRFDVAYRQPVQKNKKTKNKKKKNKANNQKGIDQVNARIDERIKERTYMDNGYVEQDDYGTTRTLPQSEVRAKKNAYRQEERWTEYDAPAKKGKVQDDFTYDKDYDYNPKMEHVTTILTVIAAVVIGCVLLFFAGRAAGIFQDEGSSKGTQQSESAERAVMPEVVGHEVDTAKEDLQAVGLGCRTTYVESTKYEKNMVISAALDDDPSTEVKTGDKIILNTTILLTVSAGADGITVPDVVGKTEAEATATLTKEGFKVTKADDYSDEYAKGLVMAQSPDGNAIAALESEITITISKGSSNVDVRVPEVLAMTQDAAKSTLEAAGLVVNSVEEAYSTEYPAGQICYQSYSTGTTVGEGTAIDLKVSIGPEVATYSCNLSITAPTDYQGGTAEVVLTNGDGTQQLWYSQNVTSFPVAINLTGFTSSTSYGIVTISYLKGVEQSVIDSDGNTSTQTNQELAQVQQQVQFVAD